MRLKSTLAISLLAMSAFLSAEVVAEQQEVVVAEVPQESSPWWSPCWDDQNFLLGINFGYGRQRTVFTTDFLAPTLAPAINAYVHYDATVVSQGFFAGILGGWQIQFCRFMWGFEANLDMTTNSFKRALGFSFQDVDETNRHWFTGTTLYDRGPIFALTTRFGYFVTPGFFPYVRAGVQTSRDTVTYQVFEGDTITPIQDLSIIPRRWDQSSLKKRIYGFVLGVGVEFPAFIGPSTVRIEYNFTQNQNMSINDLVLPITGTHNFHEPQNNIIKAAWVWNFV